ncbi:MAG: hypothetical protein PWQ96_1883 [Clostridia bacterium]|nr:hypothetical protein [Clostridia bacterium]
MRSTEIALIAPYKELATLVMEACEEWGEEIHVAIANTSEGVLIAKKLIEKGVKILISRGDTASAIRSAVNIPVVDIPITSWDIIKTLKEAKKIGKKIAVVGLEDIIYEIKDLEGILGIELFHIPDDSDIEGHLLWTMRNMELDVVVGRYNINSICKKHGFPAFFIKSGKQAVRQALKQAHEVASAKRQEWVNFERLYSVLNSTYEGIIAVDQQGSISFINKQAKKLLTLNKEDILAKHYSKVLPFIPFEDALRFKHARIGNLCHKEGKTLVNNVVPINIGADVIGAVCTIKDIDYIQSIKQKIKQDSNDGLIARYNFDDIVTNSEEMRKIIERAKKYACVDSTVLITGETGTGKEMFAQSIHNYSERREGPFVSVNCAALPQNLLESELFGYEEGAFTGAKKGGKKGLFELANYGTIFLDEIGEISQATQARLLRVLQQREVMRIGGDKVIPVNVRVVAATNKKIEELVNKDMFRRDLYHRLNVLNLRIPPLRERKKDIPLLIAALFKKLSARLKNKPPKFTREAVKMLENYLWLGNVRELENFLERLIVIKSGGTVEKKDIIEIMGEVNDNLNDSPKITLNMNDTLEEMESKIIKEIIKISKNKEEAAKRLGISTTTIWRKLKTGSK